MKFPQMFTRTVTGGGAGGTLGTDAVLAGIAANTLDNAMSARIVSINGWPLSRIAVACAYRGVGDVSAVALNIAMYVYENNLAAWIQLAQSATTIAPGNATTSPPVPKGFVFFDTVSLIDMPKVNADLDASESGGCVFLCIVGKTGGPPDGEYRFIMGAELTVKPF